MSRLVARLGRPPTTVRWRLTLLYGGLFLICGTGLLAITYALVAHATSTPRVAFARFPPTQITLGGPPGQHTRVTPSDLPPAIKQVLRSSAGQQAVRYVGNKQRISDLHQLEIESAIALAVMAIISGLLGWLVAGRVLRPLRTITATAQRLSEANLHERLALEGPRDELRTLADTIDGLLERLERAFTAQRRFVANASHELRTPLAASRALLEMAVSDPAATVESLRAACGEALEESEQQEQLIDALLALSQGERGLEVRDAVDLAAVAKEVERVYEPEAAVEGIALEAHLEPARVLGDRRLLGRLVANLVQNAVRHNVNRGWVRIRVEDRPQGTYLSMANSGPHVSAADIPRLLQPFQRTTPDRVGHHDGFGLGLSIVAAVSAAHGAALDIRPGSQGGLVVELRFPPLRTPSPGVEDGSASASPSPAHGPGAPAPA